MLFIDHKKNIRAIEERGQTWSSFFYPIITCVAIIGIFFIVPRIGRYLNIVNTRAYVFFKNIYHAQEYAGKETLLQKELASTRQDLIKFKRLEEENTLLRSELKLNVLKEKKSFVNAFIIGKGFAFGSDIVIIDEGVKAGIQPGDALITSPNILIGIITTALADKSYVRLVSDSSFQISATTIQGSRGIIKGGAGGQVTFDEIAQGSRIKENDAIITTNEVAGIPAGLLIGEIEKILSHPADIVQKAQVTISFDPYLLSTVGVITQ